MRKHVSPITLAVSIFLLISAIQIPVGWADETADAFISPDSLGITYKLEFGTFQVTHDDKHFK